MFSYFIKGITDIKCNTVFDIKELVVLIADNPRQLKIDQIRQLRKSGELEYKRIKKTLPYITPNCMVSIRSLEGDNFVKNFKGFSGYIYIDIDVPNPVKYKKYFIEKYGHLASMVCLSCSLGGITAFFKLDSEITKENYEVYWYYIKDVLLNGEPVDIQCKGIGQPMFVSSDKDVYYNPDNSILIDSEKCLLQGISWCNIYNANTRSSNINNTRKNTLNYALSIIPIKEVLRRIKTSTSIINVNPVLDYFPIDFTSSRFPNKIKDGYKRKLYPVMIHRLVFLNQDLNVNYIYSYLHFVNMKYAEPPMEQREFDRLFRFTYDGTQKESYDFQHERVKYFHFNPDAHLTGDEKRVIANQLNGKKKKNDSITKIQLAKEQLQSQGKKITKAAVARFTRLSTRTVNQHYNSELTDIDQEVQIINDSVDVSFYNDGHATTSMTGNDSGELSYIKMNNHLQEDFIHPDCPGWVFDWERRNRLKSTG
jgi:hypothetical protein